MLAGRGAGRHLLTILTPGPAALADPVVSLTAALARRYAVERELGRGGMGTVYLAWDRRHARHVALKVLPPDLADAVGPERFLREIRIVARLSHPNILPLYDSGRAGGLLYYVLPYVPGGSLADRLASEPPLPIPEALAIAREVAEALEYAHAHQVVHRDVTPANILLHENHALLADFGVARALGEARTDSDLVVGTAAYASPEQAAGSRRVDQRSDVYSLACVLYEMLAGPAPRGRDLLASRFTRPLPAVSELRPEVPSWLDEVLTRSLAANPDERYQGAAAFRDAIGGSTTASGAVPRVAPAPKLLRGRWMLAGATAFALIGAALAFLPGQFTRADPMRVVVAGFENRTGDSALAPLGEIAADYIARGLAATSLLRDVYDARATARQAGDTARAGIAAGRELARRVGAGTLLSGSYYREGDSLHFEARLVDATTGRVVLALQPVNGPMDQQTRVVELLRQRVMAGFAAVYQPRFGAWQAASVPPTYTAYEEMLAATDDLWVFQSEDAVRHLRRAIAEDSSYTGAKAALAYALSGLQECREVDSLALAVSNSGEPLAPVDQGEFTYAQASCRHDVAAKLSASKTVLRAAPRSVGFTVLAGINAIELSRPREGLAILLALDAEHEPLSAAQRNVYWSFVGYAYHDLNEYGRQLEAAAHMEEPDVEGARALAGRGDSAAVRRLVTDWIQHADTSGSALEHGECAALELRAHGSAPTARDLLERIADARGTTGAAQSGEEPCLWSLFSAHYYAGRLEQARAAYTAAAAQDTESVKIRAALAAISARLGDSVDLERQDQWLEGHPGPVSDYAIARVAAIRGHRDEAVARLRKAMEGELERHFLHIDPDFDSLREYPPYRELLRPKG